MKIPENNFQRSGAELSLRAKDKMDKAETAQEKNLKNLRGLSSELNRLQAAVSPKQQAARKMAMLKQRLEAMQHMMRMVQQFISPEQAREMVRELKSIAKEMAAAARAMGNKGGMQMPAINVDAINITADSALAGTETEGDAVQAAQQVEAAALAAAEGAIPTPAEEVTNVTDAALAEAEKAASAAGDLAKTEAPNSENGRPESSASSASSASRTSGTSGGSDAPGSDNSLRTMLKDMATMIKQILAQLKPRLRGEESQREVKELERELDNVEKALMQSVDTYTTQGVAVSVEIPAINVDVKV